MKPRGICHRVTGAPTAGQALESGGGAAGVPRGANLSTLASALGRRLLQSAAQAPAAAMQAAAAARQAAAAHAPGARRAGQRASREHWSVVAMARQGELAEGAARAAGEHHSTRQEHRSGCYYEPVFRTM